jgi:uncharacterized oxidoreductase
MKLSGNTVLVTGGATGIGFAIAAHFDKLGNKVIICGRREDKLAQAKSKLPNLITRKCDISKESDRKALYEWVASNHKQINILVNNAGIQRPIDLKKGVEAFGKGGDEIETNISSQINLIAHFIPKLIEQKESAIVNVTSGLAFVPLAMVPVYCATKAAMHSFTISLRHQLGDTSVKVYELIPPLVHDTELHHGKQLDKTDYSSSAAEVADALVKGMEKGDAEISVGASKNMIANSRSDPEKAFKNMNR